MNEHLSYKTLQRLQALKLYALALKHGDIAYIADVLHTAERDPALERLLLEFNEAMLQEEDVPLTPDDIPHLKNDLLGMQTFPAMDKHQMHKPVPLQAENRETHYEERHLAMNVLPDRMQPVMQPVWNESSHPGRSPEHSWRSGTRLQTLVALIVVCLLSSAFIGLFASYRALSGTLAVPSPRSTTATAVSAVHPHGIVVVGSTNGLVMALRAEDGRELWHYHAHSGLEPFVEQNQVIYFESDDGEVGALRLRDGKLLWYHDFSQSQGHPTQLFVSQGTVLIPHDRDTYALRATDGKILWRTIHTQTSFQNTLMSGNVQPLALDNGIAYIAVNQPPSAPGANWSNSLLALRASDGKVLWQYRTPGEDYPDQTVAVGTFVYVHISSVSAPSFLKLRATDGHVLWSQNTPSSQQFLSNLVLVGESIYLKTTHGLVCRRQASNGVLDWCASQFLSIDNTLVVIDDTIYFGAVHNNTDYELVALRATDGATRWLWLPQPNTNVNDESSIGLSGAIYLISINGIYAVNGVSGSLLWHMNPAVRLQSIEGGS